MKENKGKEIMGEEGRPEAQPQTRPSVGWGKKEIPVKEY